MGVTDPVAWFLSLLKGYVSVPVEAFSLENKRSKKKKEVKGNKC